MSSVEWTKAMVLVIKLRIHVHMLLMSNVVSRVASENIHSDCMLQEVCNQDLVTEITCCRGMQLGPGTQTSLFSIMQRGQKLPCSHIGSMSSMSLTNTLLS